LGLPIAVPSTSENRGARIPRTDLFVSLDNLLRRLSGSGSRRAQEELNMPEDFERVTEEPVPDTATQYMVRMRDGIRLATDVYLPDNGTPAEAVLVRLPYDKNSRYVFFKWVAEIFTRRGYAMVVQDVRGKFRSEGETIGFVSEANDGYDTIDWIVAQ